MHGARGEKNRVGNERTTTMFEGLLASRSVLLSASTLSPIFSVGVLLLSFISAIFFPPTLSLLVFCTSFFPVLQILFRKMKAKNERQSLLVSGFSSLFCFFSSFSSTACLPDLKFIFLFVQDKQGNPS